MDGYPKLYMPEPGETAEANPHVCILEELPCLACALVEVMDDRDEALNLADKVVNSTEARMEQLADVVARKIQGRDCTEEESALIKAYLRVPDLGREIGHFADSLVFLFPLEANEVFEEAENARVEAQIVGLVGTALDPPDEPRLSRPKAGNALGHGGIYICFDDHPDHGLAHPEWPARKGVTVGCCNPSCSSCYITTTAVVYVPGCFPLKVADRWMYQVHDGWMAVAPGENEEAWFEDCDRDRLWTPRPRSYPIDQIPPFGTITYLLDDNEGEHTHSVDEPIGPKAPHPLACPYCKCEVVSIAQPDYLLRPAKLNADGSYTIGENDNASDFDGPSIFYCHGCQSEYPVPDGTKEHFDSSYKNNYDDAPQGQPKIGAKIRWTAESYIPEPTGMDEG